MREKQTAVKPVMTKEEHKLNYIFIILFKYITDKCFFSFLTFIFLSNRSFLEIPGFIFFH
ncbi:hypothetical protein Mgra_00000989 [Meloidogyne graminicola]|uniref:Uncharacterized protein n=1 Tax=Meloidogyne graminicola TaxID=189291 RepID=A0A8T0A3Y8_9BILA|nr:hypothetical protein Mgra_00000989 [Meloidogyne graminicola]